MTEKMKAVQFVEMVRVSGQGQKDKDTPENQRAALDKYRATHPGDLVERIEPPRGFMSAALPFAKRTDLLRLKEIGTTGGFDEVRVVHLDRLTRSPDMRERAAVWGVVVDAGAVIVDVTSGRTLDPSTEEGQLEFGIVSHFAAQERRRIGERTMAGKLRAVSEGRSIGGHLPFGLDWNNQTKTWSIIEANAAIVRRIFSEAARGESSRRIAFRLNADGIPSPAQQQQRHRRAREGKVEIESRTRWMSARVVSIIRNAAYRGEFIRVVKGERSATTVPNIIEPVIWFHAQEMVGERRHRTRRQTKHQALLRSCLLCGVCGSRVYVSSSRYYSCKRNSTTDIERTGERCSNGYHPVAAVDDVVWRDLAARLRSTAFLKEATEKAAPAKVESWEKQLAACERKLRRLEEEEDELTRMRSRDLLSAAAFEKRLGDVARERMLATRTAAAAKTAMASTAARRDNLRALTGRVQAIRAALDSVSFEDRRELVEMLMPLRAGFGVQIFPDRRLKLSAILDFERILPAERGVAKLSQSISLTGQEVTD